MSINLDSLKSRLSSLENSGKRSSVKDFTWKPEVGKTQIRIVPYQFNKENPFIEAYFHYNLGRRTYLSPQTYGEADPVVEFAEQLKSRGNKEDWQLGRRMEPKMRVYVPVIVRGREHEGVKFWGFGKTVYQELLNYIVDPDYGDITDLRSGRDITVNYTAATGPGTYPSTALLIKPNQSPATEDKSVADNILNGQTDFYDVFQKTTYDELKTALESYLNQDEEDTEEDTTEIRSEAPQQTVTPKESIDAAFDDLFNE
jgi:hypothetical protein|tara:strand:+ start:175 stop:945 length:771 start_codon:yes stop_codon:yes gene_type:complete